MSSPVVWVPFPRNSGLLNGGGQASTWPSRQARRIKRTFIVLFVVDTLSGQVRTVVVMEASELLSRGGEECCYDGSK